MRGGGRIGFGVRSCASPLLRDPVGTGDRVSLRAPRDDEAQATARGLPGRGAAPRRGGRPGPVRVLPAHQAGDGDARSDRGDLPALEPRRASGQLRRAEGPARADDPVPDDRRRPRPRAARDELRPRAAGPARPALRPGAVPGQPVRRRAPRPVRPRPLARAVAALAAAAPRRPAQLLRRPAVRLGRLRRRRSSRRRGWPATTSGPSGWRWPSRTPPTGRARRPRRRSSASPGAAGPRPRPGSSGRTRGASSPTWSTTRPTSGGASPGSGASCARSTSRPSRATSGT